MRFRRWVLVSALLFALMPSSTRGQQHAIDGNSNTSLLFVVSGTSGSVEGETLILEGVPSVLYFGDRPARIAGHMSVEAFNELWYRGPNSFEANPPNAVLSLLEKDAADNVVLELTSFRADGAALHLGFAVVKGSSPQGSFGPASLFIDCMGMITPCGTQ